MPSRDGTGRGGDALVDAVADWLMAQALGEHDTAEVVGGCCDRLLAAGIPLWRAMVAFRTLHPLFASSTLVWRRDGRKGTVERQELPHGESGTSEAWRASPQHHMLETGIEFLRRRLTGERALVDFPVCRELRDAGGTDYVAYMLAFEGVGSRPYAQGVVGSWTTDRPAGFADAEVRSLARIERRLGVALKMQIKDRIAHDVLAAYLGRDAGRRVLDGLIKRGDGETIHAVIWYSDMRESTRLADVMPAEAFLATLNAYFECTAGAVLAHGGEVLRFVGDAVLAIFPIREPEATADACRRALAAAREAERRLGECNDERAARGLGELDFGLALHLGDVMFGNIGVPERLEFTVVGAAVNEAARLEGLTKVTGRRVLASGELARRLPGECEALGVHALRGVGDGVAVFAVAGERAAPP